MRAGQLLEQARLRVLEVSGSMWTRMLVESFEPLGELTALENLYLTNIQAADGSLRPLGRLKNLHELHLANFHEWKQFAELSGSLPSTACSWFAPFLVFSDSHCESCEAELVMLTGKGQPTICPRCKRDRVERHRHRFEKAAQQARAHPSE